MNMMDMNVMISPGGPINVGTNSLVKMTFHNWAELWLVICFVYSLGPNPTAGKSVYTSRVWAIVLSCKD